MQEKIITKKCSTCKTFKTFDMFAKDKSKKSGLRSNCKECQKDYCKANWEKILQNNRKHRILNMGKSAKNQALSEINKVKKAEYDKEYRKTDKGKAVLKNSSNKRRVLTKKGDLTTNQLLELQNSAKICYWCYCSLKNVKVHVDHYVPISKGGEHTLSNLVVTCQSCNNKKNAKDPILFAQSIGKLF